MTTFAAAVALLAVVPDTSWIPEGPDECRFWRDFAERRHAEAVTRWRMFGGWHLYCESQAAELHLQLWRAAEQWRGELANWNAFRADTRPAAWLELWRLKWGRNR